MPQLTHDQAIAKYKKHAERLEKNYKTLGGEIKEFIRNARKYTEKHERTEELKNLDQSLKNL